MFIKKINFNSMKALYTGAGLLMLAGILMVAVLTSVMNYNSNAEKRQEKPVEISAAAADKGSIMGGEEPRTVKPASSNIQAATQPIAEPQPAKPVAILQGKMLMPFGWQQYPLYHDWRFHTGIDLAAQEGQIIKSAFRGKVVNVYKDSHTGLTVVVQDKNYTIYYGSLSTSQVAKDTEINAGSSIGAAGTCEEKPKLHFHIAVKKDGKYIDPREVL